MKIGTIFTVLAVMFGARVPSPGGPQPLVTNTVQVDFSSQTFGAASSLEIGGVTVTAWNPAAEVAAQAGLGVGVVGLANDYSVDELWWSSGNLQGGGGTQGQSLEGVQLSVPGAIQSVTLLPYFQVARGPDLSVQLPFYSSYATPARGIHSFLIQPTTSGYSSLTLTLSDAGTGGDAEQILLGPFNDGPHLEFYPYLESQGWPDVTFQFGFTVQSLEYTPAPEPSICGLFLTMLVLLRCTRKFDRPKRTVPGGR